MTYDELTALAKTGDPLIADDPYSVGDDGLTILGSLQDGWRPDLRIRIEPGGLRAWLRDPAGAEGEDVMHGPDWAEERLFTEYDCLVDWAYSW